MSLTSLTPKLLSFLCYVIILYVQLTCIKVCRWQIPQIFCFSEKQGIGLHFSPGEENFVGLKLLRQNLHSFKNLTFSDSF
jgi:hypothetical protein